MSGYDAVGEIEAGWARPVTLTLQASSVNGNPDGPFTGHLMLNGRSVFFTEQRYGTIAEALDAAELVAIEALEIVTRPEWMCPDILRDWRTRAGIDR